MKKKIQRDIFIALHDAIISKFKAENPDHSPRSYLFYGYNDFENQGVITLRDAIIDKYRRQKKLDELLKYFRKNGENKIIYNGKYLWDARFIRLDKEPIITINRGYLESWLFYLDTDWDAFVQETNALKILNLKNEFNESYVKKITNGKSVKLRCFFHNPRNGKMDDFILEILEHQRVEIKNAPSGRSYTGKLFDTEHNRRFNLISNEGKLSSSYLSIILKNNDKDWLDDSLSIGYFACFSEIETIAGALVLEKEIEINDLDLDSTINLEKIESQVGLARKQEFIFTQLTQKNEEDEEDDEKTETNNLSQNKIKNNQLKDLCNLVDDRFIRNKYELLHGGKTKIFTKKDLLNSLLDVKKSYLELYLKSKHLHTTHGDFKSYEQFANHICVHNKGWKANRDILKTISGYYVAYVPRIRKQHDKNNDSRKIIERCLFKFGSDGKLVCHSIGAGDYEGTIDIRNQSMAHLNMKINDGDSLYHITFEIPLHKIPSEARYNNQNKEENYNLIFRGVYSGVNRRNSPVSNKIYFKEISVKEYVSPNFQPKYIEKNTIQGQAEIDNIISDYPDFKQFFSINSIDNFSEGGNIFFDNIISYSNESESLEDLTGIYEIFRCSNSTSKMDCIKKFPLEIKSNGTTIIKHRHQSIYGKVLVYGKRLVLQFFNNGHKNFDLTILIPLFETQETKINFLEGIILSASEYDEPYSCEVTIFRTEPAVKSLSELSQEVIYVNDKTQFDNLNTKSFYGFTSLGNYLLNKKSDALRKMRRDWGMLMNKKLKYPHFKNVTQNGNGHQSLPNNNKFPLISQSEIVNIIIKNLILLYFTNDQAALSKLKTMCPLIPVTNLENQLKQTFEKIETLTSSQREAIIEMWEKQFKILSTPQKDIASSSFF